MRLTWVIVLTLFLGCSGEKESDSLQSVSEGASISFPVVGVRKGRRLSHMTGDSQLYMAALLAAPGRVSLNGEWAEVSETIPNVDVFQEAAKHADPLRVFTLFRKALEEGRHEGAHKFFHPSFFSFGPLSEIETFTKLKSYKRVEIKRSLVKDATRILRCSREGDFGVSFAQTLLENGRVRETEVILKRPGQLGKVHWDFYVFDENGKLTDRSDFFTGRRSVSSSSPYVCMTCHYSESTRTFQVAPLSYARQKDIDYDYRCFNTLQ